jgi:hypothetical protein
MVIGPRLPQIRPSSGPPFAVSCGWCKSAQEPLTAGGDEPNTGRAVAITLSSTGRRSPVVSIGAPLAGAAAAYLLWWISDRLLVIGPFDRAMWGWLVVVPVWSLTPTLAALAWWPLERRDRGVAAAVVASVVGVAGAVAFWAAAAFPGCETASRSAVEWIGPSALVGVVIGGGLAASGLAATMVLRRGGLLPALLVGAALAFAVIFVAILVAVPFIVRGGCVRP